MFNLADERLYIEEQREMVKARLIRKKLWMIKAGCISEQNELIAIGLEDEVCHALCQIL